MYRPVVLPGVRNSLHLPLKRRARYLGFEFSNGQSAGGCTWPCERIKVNFSIGLVDVSPVVLALSGMGDATQPRIGSHANRGRGARKQKSPSRDKDRFCTSIFSFHNVSPCFKDSGANQPQMGADGCHVHNYTIAGF